MREQVQVSYDYEITEEEFRETEDLESLECSSQCGSFDYLNQCCWRTWWHKEEGDHCSFNLYVDKNMNHVKVKWKRKFK